MKKKRRLLHYYPVALKIAGRKLLVVGGGPVAERKVVAWHGSGAKICIISPTVTPCLRRLAKQGSVMWVSRPVSSRDIPHRDIIISATNDAKTNEKVSRWARKHRIWVNVVDQPDLSDYISPALFRAECGIVTVYTDGKDPVLSRDLKNFLRERWSDFVTYRKRMLVKP